MVTVTVSRKREQLENEDIPKFFVFFPSSKFSSKKYLFLHRPNWTKIILQVGCGGMGIN